MGFQVSVCRVYQPGDVYCNGSGLSVLKSTREEADRSFEDLSRQGHGYEAVVFLEENGQVVCQTPGPSKSDVERAMLAAARRRGPAL